MEATNYKPRWWWGREGGRKERGGRERERGLKWYFYSHCLMMPSSFGYTLTNHQLLGLPYDDRNS
jgi:hypothetical protein